MDELPHTEEGSLPLHARQQLEPICDDFDRACRRGERPRLEDFLRSHPNAVRSYLLRALVRIELEYCRRRGENPTVEEYRERFGDDWPRLRDLLPQESAHPTIPGYEILGKLDSGGMGVVYKARQLRLPRTVALKMLKGRLHASLKARVRFQIEMEAVALLEHPNVVRLYESGEHDGCPFFSMELCEGGSLKKKLAGRPQPPREAAALLEKLARAVAAAHERGIVHRDLKPSNVLLGEDGTPKIADFGLARRLDDAGENTGIDMVMGTAAYMAPEQAAGRARQAGPAADVYSLGVVLYEALAGQVPFLGENAEQTRQLVITQEPPSLRKLQTKVPRDLEAVCMKCLEKEPAQRYESATALAEDLGLFLEDRPLRVARPVGRLEHLVRWCRRNPALATATSLAAAAVLAVSVVSTLWAVHARERAAALQSALDKTEYHRAENHLDHGLSLCNSGDVGVGLLWLARALETAPEGADDLKSVILAQIAGWRRRVIPLKACLDNTVRVTAAALSPDGKTVWAAGQDNCLRRWDVASRQRLGPPIRLPATVEAIAWGPHGKVLTVGEDGAAQLWDADQFTQVGQPLSHKVVSAAWDPRGRYLVTGGADGTVRFWDCDGSRSARAGFRQKGPVKILTVNPDGTLILTGEGGNVRLWDANSGQAVDDPVAHPPEVRAATFSRDGRTVVSSSRDLTIRMWETANGKAIGGPVRQKGLVVTLAFSRDGRALVTGGHERAARVWSLKRNDTVGQPLAHEAQVHTVEFSRDGRTLLTAGADRTLKVWETVLDRPLGLTLPHGSNVRAVGFLPQGGLAFTAGWDRAVRFWDQATGASADQPLMADAPILGVSVSPDGRWLFATCFQSKCVWLWERTRPHDGIRFDHPFEVTRAAISPNLDTVVAGDRQGSVYFSTLGADRQKAATVTPWRREPAHTAPVRAIAFSPDGKTAATAGQDGRVWLWDVGTAKKRGPLRHAAAVWFVAFGPGGNTVLSACDDRRARLWDIHTGQLLEPELRHVGKVGAAVFSPDGTKVLTASADGTARLWDARTQMPLGSPLLHDDHVVTTAFSPDGTLALTGSWDGTARLWDVATGKSLGPRLAHADDVWAVAFSPDGRVVLTGSADGTARLWDLPPRVAEKPQPFSRDRLEALTGMCLDALDRVRVLDAAGWDERIQQLDQ
jgi:WD40 repeat protein/tRNA A-37 threonylcarbamoyl transferase component Bud32